MPVKGTYMKVDMSQYEASVKRLMQLDKVKKKNITRVFQTADKIMVDYAKGSAPRSTAGAYSRKYPARTHKAGHLKKGIKFKASRKSLSFYVISLAWYSAIVMLGRRKGGYDATPFIDIAYRNTKTKVDYWLKKGLGQLIKTAWDGK